MPQIGFPVIFQRCLCTPLLKNTSHRREEIQVVVGSRCSFFLLQAQLEPHYEHHSNNIGQLEDRKKPNLVCQECQGEFSSHAMLTHHMKVHRKVRHYLISLFTQIFLSIVFLPLLVASFIFCSSSSQKNSLSLYNTLQSRGLSQLLVCSGKEVDIS